MADKKAIYAPGELDKVKSRLGNLNENEAKRMQQILGGEVGYEQSSEKKVATKTKSGVGGGSSDVTGGAKGKPKRIVEIAPEGDSQDRKTKDNSNAARKLPTINASYMERVKMDVCAGDSEFGIKTPWQVFVSKLSFFTTPNDMVSKWFVKERLNEYYDHFENIVTQTRLLFPRSNLERSTKLKKTSLFSYNVLDVIRQIKLDTMASEIGRIQSHPRQVFVREFASLLREIYKPIYLLERLNVDHHISDAYNLLYKLIFIDNPSPETERMLPTISGCLASWQYISVKIRRFMYPLLMKNLCMEYSPYETFFDENEDKICALLGVAKENQLVPVAGANKEMHTVDVLLEGGERDESGNPVGNVAVTDIENILQEDEVDAEQKKAAEAEEKVVAHGMRILEKLFPKAGWDEIDTFPDFYPYFANVVEPKRNAELIAPEDPVQLALVLTQTVEELLYGFRAIKFSKSIDETKPLNSIIDDWHNAIRESFEQKYIPRIAEYAHFNEHPGQKTTPYISNLVTDLHWIRRYYFLPYYDYRSPSPPSFKKSDVTAMYTIVRHLRKELTKCAAAIDLANKSGGQAENVPVEGILNPWETYAFEVENPLSRRLNSLLGKNQRTNVSLMFFTLAIVTVLDNHLNNPNSIAYKKEVSKLFRSSDDAGKVPILWVEKKTNTMELFKQSLKVKK